MNPKLSVIIPIYKVENYLERCVKSVLNQDYRDLEVILVDDGSPDRCPQICDDLARKDDRIIVIHKTNGGLSAARNSGIEIAKGEYLVFLDSDDQWAEDKLRPLMEQLEKSEVDMLMFRSVSLYPDGIIMLRNDDDVFKSIYKEYSAIEMYQKLINSGNLHEQAGTHIMRSQFIKQNKLYFKEGILGEDTEWMFRIMRTICTIGVMDIQLQIYTEKRPGSITNTSSIKSLNDLLYVIQESIDYYKRHPKLSVRNYELAQCAYLWSIALGYYSLLPKDIVKVFKKQIKAQKEKLPLEGHPKSRIVGHVYSLLGFTLTSKILKLYMNLHSKNIVNAKKKNK